MKHLYKFFYFYHICVKLKLTNHYRLQLKIQIPSLLTLKKHALCYG